MPEGSQPPPDRFKAEMPQIPGVGDSATRTSEVRRGPLLIVGGVAAVLAAALVGARMFSRGQHADAHMTQSSQIDATVETPVAVPDLPVPVATEANPVIAQVGELANVWDSRQFNFRDRVSGESVPALMIRLPGGAAGQAGSYWAFALKAAYGRCQLEYVEDLTKLRNEYGYRGASHPMVANPCSRTVYDPLKYAAISGNVLARGAIVQGTDLRPPLGIEVNVNGKQIIAGRAE